MRGPSVRKIFIFVFVTLSLIFTLGCPAKKNKFEYGLNVQETLRVNLGVEPPTLDWNKSIDSVSNFVVSNMMEGLTQYDLKDENLNVIPALALSWTATNGAKTWTFVLRKDVKWTDGVSFNVQQLIDGWQRLLNPKTGAAYAYFLYGIKNARAYNEGKIKDFSKVGVKINKKGELVVKLRAAQSYFPSLLTHSSTFPIRKDVIEKYGDKWATPENIQTLGAYQLKIWDHDKAVVLERNESYYSTPAKIKNVLAYMIGEPSSAITIFDKGRLDVQGSLPSTELGLLKKRKEYRTVGQLSIYYYGFNTKQPPVNNPDVRRALSMAIDRDEIVQLLNGGQRAITSWVPFGMFGYEPKIGTTFNVKKAKELLVKAGYGAKKKFPKLILGFHTNENHQRVAENIQAQLKRNLGVYVEVKNEEWKVYLSTLSNLSKNKKYHLYRLGWLADFPDPDNFLNLMASFSENNFTLWGNKEFDRLIDIGASETNKEKRRKIYKKAQRILTEKDVPVIPIMSGVKHYLISDRVVNYPLNSLSLELLKEVSLK